MLPKPATGAWNRGRASSACTSAHSCPPAIGDRQHRLGGVGETVHMLARHGIAARSQRYRANGIGTGDLILSRAADDGADLIVMGSTAMRGGASLSWAG